MAYIKAIYQGYKNSNGKEQWEEATTTSQTAWLSEVFKKKKKKNLTTKLKYIHTQITGKQKMYCY